MEEEEIMGKLSVSASTVFVCGEEERQSEIRLGQCCGACSVCVKKATKKNPKC